LAEVQAKKRGVRMTYAAFDNPIFVKADRTRLKQVLMNFLSNAIKYNKPGGAVTVDCTGGFDAGNAIRINVRDSGRGMSPEQLAELFQPFNRLGQEAGEEPGIGIGLVVSNQLAELMGGTIGADSAVGEGSVFWLELTATAAPRLLFPQAARVLPVPPPLPEGMPPRPLLYVEDNPANLKLVEQIIARRPDLRLLTATDAMLGIAAARAHLPAVILMDINMPGISGIEAMKILRQDPSTAHIPIIALSANAMPHDIQKGLEIGFFNYVTKPIRVRQFMEAVDAAMHYAQFTADGVTNAAN
jgi:CheY-like chemotaxis protein